MFNLTPTEQERAARLHRDSLVADAHCDTVLEILKGKGSLMSGCGHLDLNKLRAGGIGVQFFAVFVESEYKPQRALSRTLQLMDTYFTETDKNKNQIRLVYSCRDIEKCRKDEKIAAILAVEGGECLEGDLAVLRMLYRLGVRSLGLTWNQRNSLADGVWESQSGGGLTVFGRQVIMEMNKLGMLVDLAHISERGFWDAIELSTQPVIVSHANCRALCNHPRNLTDQQLLALAGCGGVIGISFVPEFVSEKNADIYRVLDHIDHVASVAGTDCICLGSDFDGFKANPYGLEDASSLWRITEGLVDRGYTDSEIKGILGNNLLRVIKKVFR